MSRLRVALCQLNMVVGDLEGNAERILTALATAEGAGAELAVFPELAVTGYPPEDLLLKPGFVADNLEVLNKVAAATGRCAAVLGFVDEGRVDLRGRMDTDRTHLDPGCWRRRVDRQHQRVALLPGPAGRAEADAGYPSC